MMVYMFWGFTCGCAAGILGASRGWSLGKEIAIALGASFLGALVLAAAGVR